MPILHVETAFLTQICPVCSSRNRISFNHGAAKTKNGPFNLTVGGTLIVAVDGGAGQTATFQADAFSDFAHVTAAKLATDLSSKLTGVTCTVDEFGVLIESASTGAASTVAVTGGTMRAALGLSALSGLDEVTGRFVLGHTDTGNDPDVFVCRPCRNCGTQERFSRTWTSSPAELASTLLVLQHNLINSISVHCKAEGYSHPDSVGTHGGEGADPTDLNPDFPGGAGEVTIAEAVPGQFTSPNYPEHIIASYPRPVTAHDAAPYACDADVAVHDAVYLKSTDKVGRALASDPTKMPAIGFCVSKPGSTIAIVRSDHELPGFVTAGRTLTADKTYFVSRTTAGRIVNDLVAGNFVSNDIVQRVGKSRNTDILVINIDEDSEAY